MSDARPRIQAEIPALESITGDLRETNERLGPANRDGTHFQMKARYPYCPVWLAPLLLLSELVETLL